MQRSKLTLRHRAASAWRKLLQTTLVILDDRSIRIAERQVKRGLATRTVCVSYAGNLEDVRVMSSYRHLLETCHRERIELILSTMSMTGGLNVGADAFSIAFACDQLDLTQESSARRHPADLRSHYA